MTYKEAAKELRRLREVCLIWQNKEALDIAIKVLESLTNKPKLQPCICGRKRFKMWFQHGQMFYECPTCGRVSPPAKTRAGLVRAWNDMIQKEMGDM